MQSGRPASAGSTDGGSFFTGAILQFWLSSWLALHGGVGLGMMPPPPHPPGNYDALPYGVSATVGADLFGRVSERHVLGLSIDVTPIFALDTAVALQAGLAWLFANF